MREKNNMRHLKLILGLFTLVVMTGCSSLQSFASLNDSEDKAEAAVLTDYQLSNGFITIQAVGYGCTFFDSFKVAVADKSSNSLEVVRTRPDNCRMKPRNVSLQYSYKHLGLDLDRNIHVKNTVSISTTSNTAAN